LKHFFTPCPPCLRGYLLLLLALLLPGCIGYGTWYDHAADQYAQLRLETQLAPTDKRVRYSVHVARLVAGDPAPPRATDAPEFDALARRSIASLQLFGNSLVSRSIPEPDYYFLFDVRIEDTHAPGLFSGAILPFFSSREYTVRLSVQDRDGKPIASYTAGAATFEARHIFLLPFTPFSWPGRAESAARRLLFQALSVHLVADRAIFK